MYIGSQWRVHAPNNRVTSYQSDESGEVEYLFDEHGYRLTVSDANPSLVFYVSGCSLTFGVGLPERDTWPALLAEEVRKSFGVSVRYRNFAQGGASNSYIARSLMMESQEEHPDLIIAHFTYKNRAEYNGGEVPGELIGPWSTQEFALHYYANYTDREGVIASLKSLLLLQLFCEARGIEFFYGTEDPDIVDLAWPEDNAVSRGFKRLTDANRFVSSAIWQPKPEERAFDGWHPGRSAQVRHAAALNAHLRRSLPVLFGKGRT